MAAHAAARHRRKSSDAGGGGGGSGNRGGGGSGGGVAAGASPHVQAHGPSGLGSGQQQYQQQRGSGSGHGGGVLYLSFAFAHEYLRVWRLSTPMREHLQVQQGKQEQTETAEDFKTKRDITYGLTDRNDAMDEITVSTGSKQSSRGGD
ncbi:hypothetical protein VaNZ11_017113 [Volvox africanus]|uniref:Uncharacterized protein n=1 Tax=Volvox africanus TaxID=51714 RepID=A0ABQ5SP34_9CHLO|nr:hypothetical protein VaNZ11_017113 [Volvox africanus]